MDDSIKSKAGVESPPTELSYGGGDLVSGRRPRISLIFNMASTSKTV